MQRRHVLSSYWRRVNNSRLESLEARVGWRADTLIFDCEGCMGPILSGSAGSVLRRDSDVSLILVEQDTAILVDFVLFPRFEVLVIERFELLPVLSADADPGLERSLGDDFFF